jgi:hypothetical protein
VAVAPVPVVPSPKSQAWEAMVPSASFDAAPSTVTDRPATVAANSAVGAALAAGGGTGRAPPGVAVSSANRTSTEAVALPER